MPVIGNHNYSFYELSDRNTTKRGVAVTINYIGARNNTCNYWLGREYDPHDLDVDWYIKNFNQFYFELGEAIANYLEANQSNWNQSINWPNAIHARIHKKGYHAIREDRY